MKKIAADPIRYHPPAVAVAGICYDGQSTFLPGAAGAPGRIREAFYCDATNQCCENGLDLADVDNFLDAGDVRPGTDDGWLVEIEAFAAGLLEKGLKTVL